MIMELGALATRLAQSGDDRGAGVVQGAAGMLFADKSAIDLLAELQQREEDRKRGQRERTNKARAGPRRNAQQRDVTLQGVTDVTPPGGFPPTPPFPNPPDNSTQHRARGDALYAESVDNLMGMVSGRLGADWPDVDAFVKRRQYETWGAWLKEMLVALNGSALPSDLAQACRDEEALERPVGTPKAFRAFVASAVEERQKPKRAAAAGAKVTTSNARAAAAFAKIWTLIESRNGSRFIPKARVAELGDDVLYAYNACGGAEKFLNTANDKRDFLFRDFTGYINAAT